MNYTFDWSVLWKGQSGEWLWLGLLTTLEFATRVRKVIDHFAAEREKTRAWRKILEQTTSTLLRQSAQD